MRHLQGNGVREGAQQGAMRDACTFVHSRKCRTKFDGRVGAVLARLIPLGLFVCYSEDMNLEKERLRLDGQIVEQA